MQNHKNNNSLILKPNTNFTCLKCHVILSLLLILIKSTHILNTEGIHLSTVVEILVKFSFKKHWKGFKEMFLCIVPVFIYFCKETNSGHNVPIFTNLVVQLERSLGAESIGPLPCSLINPACCRLDSITLCCSIIIIDSHFLANPFFHSLTFTCSLKTVMQ